MQPLLRSLLSPYRINAGASGAVGAASRAARALHRSSVVATATATTSATASASASAGLQDGDTYDVVIVGGGMVGAAVAALLAARRMTSQLRVAVLDVKPQPTTFQPRAVPDLRVSTITPGSIEMLRAAGAWEEVEPLAAPFTHMQVWDAGSSGHIRWGARDTGEERMGVVAENALLAAALLAAAQRGGGGDRRTTEFIWPAELRAMRLPADGDAGPPLAGPSGGGGGSGSGGDALQPGRRHGLAELELADGRVLATRLVVAADGAASRVRQMAGLRTWGWGYGQRGVVATVSTAEPSDTAWQRFLPTGPLALLPVRDGFSSIVWSTSPQVAAALEAMSPAEFAAAVNKALRDPPASATSGTLASLLGPIATVLGGGSTTASGSRSGSSSGFGSGLQEPPLVVGWEGGPPRSFPLQLKQAGRYTLPRLALVGDAAHAVHPLAGQGVNLGFGDASALADALAGAVETGTDPGDARMLYDGYEAPRRRAVLTMTTALDAIKTTFAVQSPGFATLRGLGLRLINAAAPVRNGIMQYAMLGQMR